MDSKTRPIYMLPVRDTLQIERYTHSESKGVKKDTSCKLRKKLK